MCKRVHTHTTWAGDALSVSVIALLPPHPTHPQSHSSLTFSAEQHREVVCLCAVFLARKKGWQNSYFLRWYHNYAWHLCNGSIQVVGVGGGPLWWSRNRWLKARGKMISSQFTVWLVEIWQFFSLPFNSNILLSSAKKAILEQWEGWQRHRWSSTSFLQILIEHKQMPDERIT